MATKKVLIEIKSAYGQKRIYPVNEIALALAKLMRRKTFDMEDLETIKVLGFEILEKDNPSIFD